MRRLFWVFCLLGFLVACSQAEPSFKDNHGKSIRFSAYRGKWIVLNYWAKWCGSCLAEIPMLNKFAQAQSKNVVVLGVNYDDLPAAQLKKLVHQLKITYPVLQKNPGHYLKLGDINVVPTTIIIDPNGVVVQRLLGPQTMQNLQRYTQ